MGDWFMDKISAPDVVPALPKILECSTKGDKRFSALVARVTVLGVTDTIENHYQMSKRVGATAPKHWKELKGRKPTHIHIDGKDYPPEYLTPWYKYLWLCYLDSNPALVEYASQYDDFNDIFRGKALNCQADVVRQYVKEGRESLEKDCEPLMVDFKARMGAYREKMEKRNKEFHLIVAGGRHFSDYYLLRNELDKLLINKKETHEIVIVSGAARGADKLGERYAEERGYRISSHPADWERYGKSAGYRRNEDMAYEADALAAFWDGVSKGTNHMINIANEHGLAVRVIRY